MKALRWLRQQNYRSLHEQVAISPSEASSGLHANAQIAHFLVVVFSRLFGEQANPAAHSSSEFFALHNYHANAYMQCNRKTG